MKANFIALIIAITIATWLAPAPTQAKIYNEFLSLSQRHLSPPPLVPVSAPPALTPLGDHLRQLSSRKKGSYLFRITRAKPGRLPDAVIALERGYFKSLGAAKRESKRSGLFRAKPTKVRGHKGYLFTRVFGARNWDLTWLEDGKVYSIGTGTTKTISLKQLRATADGLEHLGREYIGSIYDRNLGDQSAIVVTTDKTVSATIEWTGRCMTPDGIVMSPRGGQTELSLVARQGNSFTFSALPGSPPGSAWTLTGSGTIGPSATSLSFRASGVIDGLSCDTGPIALVLDQRATD